MNDTEYAAAIQDVCKRGATISAIKCFVESIRRDEREACANVCEELSDCSARYLAEQIRERSNK